MTQYKNELFTNKRERISGARGSRDTKSIYKNVYHFFSFMMQKF